MGDVPPLTLQWQDGYALSPKDTNYVYENTLYNSVTLVVDLNWESLLNADLTNGTLLFSINDSNEKNHGMGLYVDKGGKHLDAWVNNKDAYLAIDLKYSDISDAELYTNAAIVFTSYDTKGAKSFFESRLYLSTDNGMSYTLKLGDITDEGWDDGGFDSISSFSYNGEYVNKMDVYNSYLNPGEEHLVAIRNLKNDSPPGTDSTIPEPTTATLSLLALAGLAARRRR